MRAAVYAFLIVAGGKTAKLDALQIHFSASELVLHAASVSQQ